MSRKMQTSVTRRLAVLQHSATRIQGDIETSIRVDDRPIMIAILDLIRELASIVEQNNIETADAINDLASYQN